MESPMLDQYRKPEAKKQQAAFSLSYTEHIFGYSIWGFGHRPAGRGVCAMSTSWRDKQQPSLINFIAAFLAANSYRLNFLSISPDFIFNNGELSVAFIFETNWDCQNEG
jgi:hypothetical protein